MSRDAVAYPPTRVRFPIVSLGKSVLVELLVERLPPLDDKERFCAGHDRREAVDVLMDARAIDPPDRRFDGVGLRFLARDFSGASFGLALALADKMARFPRLDPDPIVATGEIVCGGMGQIAPVEGFEAKAVAVVEAAAGVDRPIVFACSARNLTGLAPSTRALLDAAVARGELVVQPAETLAELKDLWSAPINAKKSRSRSLSLGVAAAVIVGFGMVGAWWAWQAPLRVCERAAEVLDPVVSRNDPARVASAVVACDQAAKVRPRDGRAQFLAGQTEAVNGAQMLAQSHWRRAAELGDIDGMATWGRHLWLSASTDPQTVIKARTWLERAAKAGSTTAMEDLADLYSDGQALPVDPIAAKHWQQEAERTRGNGQ